jgi:hypothetical protein
MLRHFPFEDSFDPGMGMRALNGQESLCDLELDKYLEETALKHRLLTAEYPYYFHGGAETMPAQWDVFTLVATDLARNYPQYFQLQRQDNDWQWRNELTNQTLTFRFGDASSLPNEPLDWIGRQVQEDLVLLGTDPACQFVGGQLCFANGWDIGDRLGKSFLDIHRRTPQTTMPSVDAGARFLQKLKPGRTYWRMSWNFKLSNQLDMTTKHKPAYKADFAQRAPKLTPEEIGSAVFIRIERQTFTRLAPSGGLLFGIHTYNSTVAEEAADPKRALSILNVVRGAPRDVKDYKAITPIENSLVRYLETRAA